MGVVRGTELFPAGLCVRFAVGYFFVFWWHFLCLNLWRSLAPCAWMDAERRVDTVGGRKCVDVGWIVLDEEQCLLAGRKKHRNGPFVHMFPRVVHSKGERKRFIAPSGTVFCTMTYVNTPQLDSVFSRRCFAHGKLHLV